PRDGYRRCPPRRIADLLDQPQRRRSAWSPSRRPARARPRIPHPRSAGRLAGRCASTGVPTPMSLPHGLVNASPNALPLHLVDRSGMAAWRDAQPEAVRTWFEANGFEGAPGSVLLLPGDDGIRGAVVGTADPLDPYSYGQAPYALPPFTFKLTGVKDPAVAAAARLGWGLGAYRFDRYKQPPRQPAMLQVDAAD